MPLRRPQILIIGSMVLALLLVLSGIRPFDRTTWILEVFPILIAWPWLFATYRRFPLTSTQSDMFFALIGAVSTLLTLSRLHDIQLAKISSLEAMAPSSGDTRHS